MGFEALIISVLYQNKILPKYYYAKNRILHHHKKCIYTHSSMSSTIFKLWYSKNCNMAYIHMCIASQIGVCTIREVLQHIKMTWMGPADVTSSKFFVHCSNVHGDYTSNITIFTCISLSSLNAITWTSQQELKTKTEETRQIWGIW